MQPLCDPFLHACSAECVALLPSDTTWHRGALPPNSLPAVCAGLPFSFARRLHSDMQDNQSVAVADPTERVVKAIVYIHDCEPGGGANVR